MDAALKKDIQDHFHAEYYQAAKAEKKGLLKFIDGLNDKFENFANRLGLNAPGLGLLGSFVLAAVSPPAATVAIGVWIANYTEQIIVAALDHGKARKAIDRDIDNGALPARYNEVLDSKIDGLKGEIELYTAQKTQLPPSGTAAAAFAAALAAPANENDAPAPAPKLQPPTPKP